MSKANGLEDKTKNTSKLPAFASIKAYERKAIVLRTEGKSYRQVTDHINAVYSLDYAEITIREWFYSGGRLEQANREYNDFLSAQTLAEARNYIKQSSLKAAKRLVQVVDSARAEDRDAIRAAVAVLNKYIPDRQVVIEEDGSSDELPDELVNAGIQAALEGDGNDTSEPDNSPESESNTHEAGDGSRQEVDSPVLSEQDPAQQPSE